MNSELKSKYEKSNSKLEFLIRLANRGEEQEAHYLMLHDSTLTKNQISSIISKFTKLENKLQVIRSCKGCKISKEDNLTDMEIIKTLCHYSTYTLDFPIEEIDLNTLVKYIQHKQKNTTFHLDTYIYNIQKITPDNISYFLQLGKNVTKERDKANLLLNIVLEHAKYMPIPNSCKITLDYIEHAINVNTIYEACKNICNNWFNNPPCFNSISKEILANIHNIHIAEKFIKNTNQSLENVQYMFNKRTYLGLSIQKIKEFKKLNIKYKPEQLKIWQKTIKNTI